MPTENRSSNTELSKDVHGLPGTEGAAMSKNCNTCKWLEWVDGDRESDTGFTCTSAMSRCGPPAASKNCSTTWSATITARATSAASNQKPNPSPYNQPADLRGQGSLLGRGL